MFFNTSLIINIFNKISLTYIFTIVPKFVNHEVNIVLLKISATNFLVMAVSSVSSCLARLPL
jgi:hypothetical protein